MHGSFTGGNGVSRAIPSSQPVWRGWPPLALQPLHHYPNGFEMSGFSVRHQGAIASLSDLEQVYAIGVGNFGSVFVVRSKQTGLEYALKVLSKEQVIKRNQLKHTIDELKTLKAIRNHPFMVHLCVDSLCPFSDQLSYASFMDCESLYLTLELGSGELFTLLRNVGRFDFQATVIYSAEIVCCYDYLHQRDIVYRDLKPENVLLGADRHLRLCDFGFSKVIRPSERTWTVCGTPEYMAPEIILGKGHDRAVDYWSLGVFIFELLAGYPPFLGDDTIAIYENIIDANFSFPTFFTDVVKDIVSELLHRTRSKRLGNLVGGIADIKNHSFFGSVNWDDLLAGRTSPPELPSGVLFEPVKSASFKVTQDAEDIYVDEFKDWDTSV